MQPTELEMREAIAKYIDENESGFNHIAPSGDLTREQRVDSFTDGMVDDLKAFFSDTDMRLKFAKDGRTLVNLVADAVWARSMGLSFRMYAQPVAPTKAEKYTAEMDALLMKHMF